MLDIRVRSKRGRKAALKFLRKLVKRLAYVPDAIATDRLWFFSAAIRNLGPAERHVTGGRSNNRAKVSHQPTRRREWQQIRFKSPGSAQRCLSSHAAIANHVNVQRHLSSRRTLQTLGARAMADWREIVAA
ncbi:DDE-type integrase/transposase/recombinase [Tropicimonas sp. IMCC6043]|uniref:DDE-type integrase/transposase/recombinase n=1 Tax=Tropicimonas sp. IMCC6043 TaxID=2510645 RepID=UPI00101CFCF6|nr:IS6 family transposase [Tropicimonas sp. IMCC6043]